MKKPKKLKKQLYFLCTGNACRSQIAKGWGKVLLSDQWDVHSAGIEAHGVNPKAIEVMLDVGVDITNHQSKTIDMDKLVQADMIITLCGDAAESCPRTPSHIPKVHWGFPDPAKATGTDEEKWLAFIEVRDAIKQRIEKWMQE